MNPVPTSSLPSDAAITPGWQAQLLLAFDAVRGRTRLSARKHSGPLRVQKALYPEGPQICHALIIHPPGGVVGGDQLAITLQVGAAAQALLSTPGAGKWYKANGRQSRQQLDVVLEAGAKLEYLPQETILFDAAQVHLQQNIHLAADACYIGWEIVCFGRRASNECFGSGRLRQQVRIWRGPELVWFEQGGLDAQGEQMGSMLGLRGYSVCASMIALGPALSGAALQAIRSEVEQLQQQWLADRLAQRRDAVADCGQFGISQSKAVLVVRYLGDSSELARQIMMLVWAHVRPVVIGSTAQVPRIWQT